MKAGNAFPPIRRAASGIHEVPIEVLRFGLSPRLHGWDPGHVEALGEVLHQVPPVVVHAPSLQVIDGVHRVLAARSKGRRTIHAVMFDGDDVAAQIEAVRSNIAHGKPMSLAEREAAALRVIELEPAWSDRRIAGATGLSPKTVGRLRRRATVDLTQTSVRIGSDGRARPVDPIAMRLRVAEAVRAAPDASTRSLARTTGASQATVRDVRDRLGRGLEPCSSPDERKRRARSPQPDADCPPPDQPTEVTSWIEQRMIDAAEWHRFVPTIPLGRIYDLADICRQQSDHWRDFAAALEDRARRRRRGVSRG